MVKLFWPIKPCQEPKKLKKLVHLALQFLAMFLCLIGLWAVWKFHDERKIDHLYTLHSWMGLTCIIFFSLQWATGFWTFWYPGGSRSGRASLLPWHVFFGIFIYALAIATSVSGLLEKSIYAERQNDWALLHRSHVYELAGDATAGTGRPCYSCNC